MEYRATLIPGDAIGPEVTGAALRVAEASRVHSEWKRAEAGVNVYMNHGTPRPDEVLDSIRRTRLAAKLSIGTRVRWV